MKVSELIRELNEFAACNDDDIGDWPVKFLMPGNSEGDVITGIDGEVGGVPNGVVYLIGGAP